jgi:hypothetical protein
MPLVPVTVKVVVDEGAAVGFAQFVQLRPVAGLQENEFAPAAVRDVEPPAQSDVPPLTVTTGTALTATVTVAESIQPSALIPTTL